MDNNDPFRNRKQAARLRNFSGMRFGSMMLTDIDGYLEYHHHCHVFVETKYKDSKLPLGQRIAYERLCDDLQTVRPTIVVVSSHEAEADEDIDVANTTVSEYRLNGHWHTPDRPRKTREFVDGFIGWVEKNRHE